MEIVRKVVSVVVLLMIIPAIIFLPVINYELTSPMANELLSAETDKEYALGDVITGKDIFDLATGRHEISGLINDGNKPDLKWPPIMDSVKVYAIFCAVFFALTLVAAVFVIIWSIASKNRIVPIAVCGGGVVTMLLSKLFFGKVCAPIIAGSVNLVDIAKQLTGGAEGSTNTALDANNLVTSIISGLGGSIISGFGQLIKVNILEYGSFLTAIIACFVIVIVWNISYYVVELGEDSESLKKNAAKKNNRKKA